MFIYTLSIILIIIILTILLLKKKNKNIESFTLNNYQSGISNNNISGTIKFTTPFNNIPIIFTQIIGKSNTLNNVYSVQIYNIATTSFDYIVNKIYYINSSKYDILKLDNTINKENINSNITFYWIAFDEHES